MTNGKAIITLNSLKQYYNDKNEDGYVGFDDEDNEALDYVINLLKQTRWIPVSERLPELGERVLCQCQANIYEVLKLTVDGWYYNPNHCYMESFVIAWMPLPHSYRVESEVNADE